LALFIIFAAVKNRSLLLGGMALSGFLILFFFVSPFSASRVGYIKGTSEQIKTSSENSLDAMLDFIADENDDDDDAFHQLKIKLRKPVQCEHAAGEFVFNNRLSPPAIHYSSSPAKFLGTKSCSSIPVFYCRLII